MNRSKSSGAATIGWLLILAGLLGSSALAFSILREDGYKRRRFVSLFQGEAGVDGIGIENWLLLGSPLLVIGLGVALIIVTRTPSAAQP